MTFCSECGHKIDDTAKFCSDCGTKVNKESNATTSTTTDPIDTTSSAIKSFSKVSYFRNTLTSTASKIGGKLSHSKSPIGISQFNLQNSNLKKETEVNTKQPVDPATRQREILYRRLEIYRDKLLQIDRRNRFLIFE